MLRGHKNRKALTLMELLIVISIVALLATLVVLVVPSVKLRMEVIKCAGNLAQFSRAALQYANEWQGVLPSSAQLRGDTALDKDASNKPLAAVGETEYFFESQLKLSLSRYRMKQAGNLDVYYKCPAMCRLSPDRSPKAAESYAYCYRSNGNLQANWITAPSNVLTTKLNGGLMLLFCGATKDRTYEIDLNASYNKYFSAPMPTSLHRNDGGPQFPHYLRAASPDDTSTHYLTWYVYSKTNVARMDGRVSLLKRSWNSNTDFDPDVYLMQPAPTQGLTAYTIYMEAAWGRQEQ